MGVGDGIAVYLDVRKVKAADKGTLVILYGKKEKNVMKIILIRRGGLLDIPAKASHRIKVCCRVQHLPPPWMPQSQAGLLPCLLY